MHDHLGLCLERTGRLVRALDAFERSVALRSASPDPPLERDAEEHIAALRQRIPTVALRMPPDAPREPPPAVFIDGVAIAIGPRSIPLDPGPHRFVVQAAGRAAFEAERSLREREAVVLDVIFDEAPKASASAPSRGDARAPNADADTDNEALSARAGGSRWEPRASCWRPG